MAAHLERRPPRYVAPVSTTLLLYHARRHREQAQRERCEARETDGEYKLELLTSAQALDQEAGRLEEIARRLDDFVERLAS